MSDFSRLLEIAMKYDEPVTRAALGEPASPSATTPAEMPKMPTGGTRDAPEDHSAVRRR